MPHCTYHSRLCVAEKSQICPASPYSPDIVASDFFLFGDLKRELRGSCFQTGEEPLAEIRKLVGEMSPENLLDVFHDWISWRESLIASDGNYFE
jgi:hypothetical protein